MTLTRKHIVQAVEGVLPDEVGNWVSGDLALSIVDVPTPSHVSSPESVSVVRFSSTLDVSRYVTGIPATPEAEYVLSTSRPFTSVELPVTGVSSADRITVTAAFESADGRRDTDRYVFENEPSFTPDDRTEVSLGTDLRATEATVTVSADGGDTSSVLDSLRATALQRATGRRFVPPRRVTAGVPAVRRPSAGPPVFLFSVDTLRWDVQDALEPLVEALGGPEVVVEEPRTKAHWTPPSHGCMFTGLHPGDHRYVGLDHGATSPIDPNVTTLGDVLHSRGYKTRGLVSHTRILPEVGFGHGFFQYRLENMGNWLTREFDAGAKTNTLSRWIDRDARTGGLGGTFYFLHVFDPHMPYIPPLPSVEGDSLDLAELARFNNTVTDVGVGPDYVEFLDGGVSVDGEVVDRLRSYYEASVAYTAEQLAGVIEHLKRRGVFQESLVVVTGDHGEEFGERKFYGHNSLYDANVRPFMAVKPPDGADWETPTAADTIDILPTVARTVGASVPDTCQGAAWQDGEKRSVRIVERIRPDWYNVAVERDGVKGVFTYEENYPDLPTEAAVEEGPVREEYYRIEDVRNGQYSECDPGRDIRRRLREDAETHALRRPVAGSSERRTAEVTQDTEERLEHLGYK